MGRRTIRLAAVVMCAALATAGCSADDGPEDGTSPAPGSSSTPTSAGEASTSPEPAAEATAAPLTVTRQLRGVDVEVTVHPVAVRDGLGVLVVDYAVAPGDAADLASRVNSLGMVLDGGATGHHGTAQGVRLVDEASDEVLPVAPAADGSPGSEFVQAPADDSAPARTTSVHAAPDGDTIDVLLPSLGYVLDVPVVPADEDFDAALTAVGGVTSPASFELRSFQTSYDDTASTQEEGDEVTVTLTSDVLFGSSSAKLSAKAKSAVDKAADRIRKSADHGKVQVVGHTDDVDSDAFNQTLSQKRASAVAKRLQSALGGDFTVTSSGRGESEPVAVGTSAEARAANRRVEISFVGNVAARTETAAKIPKSDVPTVAAGQPVEVSPADDTTYSITADGFERSGDLIFGTVRVDLVEGAGTTNMRALLRPGGDAASVTVGRGFGAVEQVASTHGFALLTDDGRTYPLDYQAPSSDGSKARHLVGDELLAWNPESPGETLLATAVWPDTGQDTVTLEVPGKFRITDIPVSAAG